MLELSVKPPLYAQKDWYQLDSTTFASRFPGARLLDHGKLNLYSYRDYDGSFKGSGNSEKLAVAAGELLLELLDSPVDYYFVQVNGQFEEVRTEKGFKEKIGQWFADDPHLLQYIRTEKIKSKYVPYLVRMYNGHAPRPFDPGFQNVSIEFVADGFMDKRDGRLYDIIIANNITWMAENLKYCPWDNCKQDTSGGVYYNWKGATNVCPAGWRLPDETDWKTLCLGFGLPLDQAVKISGFDKNGDIGKKMLKDSANAKGFNVIKPAILHGYAFFWTAKESSKSRAVVIEIKPSNKVDYNYSFKKSGGVNVRCVCGK
jgi:uncharacterized protein (TIGR02145 family)